MPTSCIPGYDDALADERRIREEAFLDVPGNICGVRIRQITPFLFARLCRMETPFLRGREATKAEIAMFLWALSPLFVGEHRSYRRANLWRRLLRRPLLGPFASRDSYMESLASHLFGRWDEAEEAIHNFLFETFVDAPMGGSSESVPYVTGIAWMIFRMGCQPFCWKKEETLHTPMRVIYQLMRCQDLDAGKVMYNPSDKIKARYLDYVNQQIRERRN